MPVVIYSRLLKNIRNIERASATFRTYYSVKKKFIKDENFLSKQIYQTIKAKGPITVADYMKEVLTHPMEGYYMSKDMFGEKGDFVTSPEISQMFGEMVAVWFLNEWHKMGSPMPFQIIELGPGRGTLSSDILKVFSHFKALHNASLQLVEISPYLSELQAKNLCQPGTIISSKSPCYKEGVSYHDIPIKWYKQLKDVPECFTLLIAHEFFDALPIYKFHKAYGGYREVLIDAEAANETDIKFKYVLSRNETPMMKVLIKPEETRDHVEISADAVLIYKDICERIKRHGGIGLICDYGHNGNGTDTFRAFRKHEQVDPLIMPGTADLTADVDFNLIRQAANESGGIISLGPVTQKDFLVRIGINHRYKSLMQNIKNKKDQDSLRDCYEFLVDPSKMGERFKFFALVPSTIKKIIDRFPVVGF